MTDTLPQLLELVLQRSFPSPGDADKIRTMFADDLGVSAKMDVGNDTKLTAHAGWFVMNQKIAMDWHVNKSLRELSGTNPSQLDIYSGAGGTNQLSVAGQYGFNNNWGDCCAREYDLSYTDNAPNVSLDLDTPLFGIDGSVRFDSVKASGSARASSGTTYNTVVGGVSIPTFLADGKTEVLNYTRSYTSWTLGGLIHANKDTTVFVRASRGGRLGDDPPSDPTHRGVRACRRASVRDARRRARA